MDDKKKLTHENGAPVADNRDVETVGPRGPMVLQDLWFLEKLAHFDREVIPERRMHAKGSGAHGVFTVTKDVTGYTKARLFSEIGKRAPVFTRFSTVAGERGAADTERDIRGFATKFYTEDGIWDLVGNNTPVFFIRDPLQFPDLNHAIKRDPRTNTRNAQTNWDFWSSLPEALQQVTIVMSDKGIPDGYRHMDGFGSHTFSLYNAENQRHWVKFHLLTQQGIKNLTDAEAEAIVAKDREHSQHDLYNAIERGEFPRWTMFFQIMTEQQAESHRDNPFDITKTWDETQYPLIEAGVLELNRNPENYFAEVEQAAFNPAHIVPGIGHSPDKLLQGRLFSYGDAQRYRLGVNHMLIPINTPKNGVHDYHRDGLMRVDGNYGSTKGYYPNSIGEWEAQPAYSQPPLPSGGDIARYTQYDEKDDCFYQTGDRYRTMNESQRRQLIDNTVRSIASVTDKVKYRHTTHCYMADIEYGRRLTKALGLQMDWVEALSKMNLEERMKATRRDMW